MEEDACQMRNVELLPTTVSQYLQHHKLHEVLTATLDEVCSTRPADPYTFLLESFAARASDPPCFHSLAAIPLGAEFQCQFLLSVRSVVVRCQEFSVSAEVFAEDPGADPPFDPLAYFSTVSETIRGVLVTSPFGLRELFLPPPGAQLRDSQAVVQRMVAQAIQAQADAQCVDMLGYLQKSCAGQGLLTSPALQETEAWASKWPVLVFPVLAGGEPSLVADSVQIGVSLKIAPSGGGVGPGDFEAVGASAYAIVEGARAKLHADKKLAAFAATAEMLPKVPETIEAGITLVQQAIEGWKAGAEAAGSASVALFCGGDAIFDGQSYSQVKGSPTDVEALTTAYVAAHAKGVKLFIQPYSASNEAYDALRSQCASASIFTDDMGAVPSPARQCVLPLKGSAAFLLAAFRAGCKKSPKGPAAVMADAISLEQPADLFAVLALPEVSTLICPQPLASTCLKAWGEALDDALASATDE